MSKHLVIIGASGHGKVVADIAERTGYSDIIFLDDNPKEPTCAGYPVLGGVSDAEKYKDGMFFVAIGNSAVREKIQKQLLELGLSIETLVHPSATIGKGVKLGIGSVMMAGAVINSDAQVGDGCIINTCASVDHDCKVGDYVHISVGAHVSGSVDIGNNTWVGAGATINNNINIISNCMIGAGAVVIHDLVESGTYVGVPAKIC